MATQLSNLVCDNSTLTNFKSWAQSISNFIGSTAGWSQSSDTGQVNWSTISSVPGTNSYVYEIWEPNDSISPNFFAKIEYGNSNGGSNYPAVRLSIAQSTDGAGNLTGTVLGPFSTLPASGGGASPSSSAQYECRFSGAPGRLTVMMWRNTSITNSCAFGIERSINASGSYTGTYVTLMVAGQPNNTNASGYQQQSLHFTAGLAPAAAYFSGNNTGILPIRYMQAGTVPVGVFNGTVAFDTVAPYVGFWDNPLTSFGGGPVGSYSEGQVFTVVVYGATRTYIASKAGPLAQNYAYINVNGGVPGMVGMRWD